MGGWGLVFRVSGLGAEASQPSIEVVASLPMNLAGVSNPKP